MKTKTAEPQVSTGNEEVRPGQAKLATGACALKLLANSRLIKNRQMNREIFFMLKILIS